MNIKSIFQDSQTIFIYSMTLKEELFNEVIQTNIKDALYNFLLCYILVFFSLIIFFQGDSGGPMFTTYQRRSYLFGITSMHTSKTCNPTEAFAYTRVPRYIHWINSIIRKSSKSCGPQLQGSWSRPQASFLQFNKKGNKYFF